jgi:hypothetical protein
MNEWGLRDYDFVEVRVWGELPPKKEAKSEEELKKDEL